MELEIVYRVIKTKRIKGKDAMKKAREFCKELRKNPKVDDIEAWNIYNGDGTDRYYDPDNKWKFEEVGG